MGIILGSCGPRSELGQGQAPGSLENDKTPKRAVTAKELSCVEGEFGTHVHWGTSSTHVPLDTQVIRFTVESYVALRDARTCKGDSLLGLMVHYGADTSAKAKRVSLAFSMVCLAQPDTIGQSGYRIHEPLYAIDANAKLAMANTTMGAWRSWMGKRFQDSVVVDTKDDSVFDQRYQGLDAHMIFRCSDIDTLIAHNQLAPTDHLELVPIAEPVSWDAHNRGEDFSMHLCLVAQMAGQRLISDSAGTKTFEKRGSDLGSACPPTCVKAAFPDSGVAVRPGC